MSDATSAPSDARGYLLRQLEMGWALASHHLESLTTEECLWRPARVGLHVIEREDGSWAAQWPEHERYDLGPASIAWITWHMIFWWSTVLDHSFGSGTLAREDVAWPGSADGVRRVLDELQERWQAALAPLADEDLRSTERTRWPFRERPFGDVIAWVNVELIKNAAELGYARFAYAVRER
jgi:hypothetical protein